MMVEALAALLEETGEAHHQAFLETDGDDPEWAQWYADYLHERLNAFFERDVTQAEITQALTRLDAAYQTQKISADWSTYYAQAMIQRWG